MNFIESNNHVDRFLIESRSGDSNFALGQSWGPVPVILRLPQVILDVGVEVNGYGPAVAEDGLTDVLFVVGWHGTVAAVVFVVALTVEKTIIGTGLIGNGS